MSGKIIKLDNLENLPSNILEDGLESGVDKLFIPSALVKDDFVAIPEGAAVMREKVVDGGGNRRGRRLQTNEQRILVVRVKSVGTILNGETTFDAADIADNVFGTYGKEFNSASQFEKCSFGKFKPVPVPLWNEADGPFDDTGVYTVTIQATSTDRTTVMNEVTAQLNNDFTFASLPNGLGGPADDTVPFDFVMYCLPPGTGTNWFAYAYLNGVSTSDLSSFRLR